MKSYNNFIFERIYIMYIVYVYVSRLFVVYGLKKFGWMIWDLLRVKNLQFYVGGFIKMVYK